MGKRNTGCIATHHWDCLLHSCSQQLVILRQLLLELAWLGADVCECVTKLLGYM